MAWDEWRLSLEKTKVLWLQAGEKRTSDGKWALGVGRGDRRKGGFCLYWHVAGSLHAWVILTSFSLQRGSLWHPDPRKYKQMSPGRPSPLLLPAASTSFTHRVLYHNWLFHHLCISIVLNSLLPPPPSTQSQRKGEDGFNALISWAWCYR